MNKTQIPDTYSADALRSLAAQASTLSERSRGDVRFAHSPLSERRTRLEKWRRIAAGDDGEQFRRQLAFWGLTEESASSVLGAVEFNPSQPLPEWTQRLPDLIRLLETDDRPWDFRESVTNCFGWRRRTKFLPRYFGAVEGQR